MKNDKKKNKNLLSRGIRTKSPKQHNLAPHFPPLQQLAGRPQTFLLSDTTDSNFTLWLLLVFLPKARRLGGICRSLFKRTGEEKTRQTPNFYEK